MLAVMRRAYRPCVHRSNSGSLRTLSAMRGRAKRNDAGCSSRPASVRGGVPLWGATLRRSIGRQRAPAILYESLTRASAAPSSQLVLEADIGRRQRRARTSDLRYIKAAFAIRRHKRGACGILFFLSMLSRKTAI